MIDRYENLLELGQQRRQKLEESCKAFQLVREAGELAQWITDKVRRRRRRQPRRRWCAVVVAVVSRSFSAAT